MADELEPHTLRVFYAWTHTLARPERLARGLAVLSAAERERASRFVFDRDRYSYVLAHALLRSSLCALVGGAPQELRFEVGERGRPELAAPRAQPRVRFNISHTQGLVACALALEHDVGVDVEHVDRKVEIDQLARNVFSAQERAALARLERSQQRQRFFQLWTLKESYIKARGLGLALPLREITCHLDERPRPELELSSAIADDAARWWLDVRPLGVNHMLAFALRAVPRTVQLLEYDPTA